MGLLTETDGQDGDGGESDEETHDVATDGDGGTALVGAVGHVGKHFRWSGRHCERVG